MLPSHAEIESAVLASVNALAQRFRTAPYSFLYESDLQATLFVELRSRLTGRLHIPRSGGGQPPYDLGIVYSEYYSRIDIACLNPAAVQSVATSTHKGYDTYIYNLPVFVGVELKYRKMGDDFDFRACLGDFGKLAGLSVARPLVLGFIQDASDEEAFLSAAPSSSRRRSVSELSALSCICIVSPRNMWTFAANFSA